MTKADALRIQAEQVAWYNRNGDRPWLAEKVAAMTTADALEDGKEYPVWVINKHIPRGADIERLCEQTITPESKAAADELRRAGPDIARDILQIMREPTE
jgi:hypothetical protein